MVPERWLSYVGRGFVYLVITRLTCQLPENGRNLNPGGTTSECRPRSTTERS